MREEELYDVIRAPLVTEKSTMVSENNQVMFKVAMSATKPDIKEAFERLFNVNVLAVNTLIRKGKVRKFRGVKGQQSDFKKAIVTLEEGQTIDITTRL